MSDERAVIYNADENDGMHGCCSECGVNLMGADRNDGAAENTRSCK